MEPFKGKCPNCGKETISYDPNKKTYCSKECSVNFKYGDKYIGDRYFKNTPLKDK